MNAEQHDSPRGDTAREADYAEILADDIEAVAPTLGEHRPAHEAPPGTDAPVSLATIARAMVFPLFFVVMFALCYVSAFHNPAPHDMRLTISAPAGGTRTASAEAPERAPCRRVDRPPPASPGGLSRACP
ncbi:hypothetical protein [Tomitella cavernea]|uniref:Uncharacterized protein n=1 Tax=Tomitella cavernea TaxID=1387982 RepID=A0ABP9CU57_9ACTN|nr:hypothetical protein [Tomitella cavernea]